MASVFFRRALILVRGGGDLASGAIFRLHRAGLPVIVTELPAPLFVRRTVSYGEAVYSDTITVEGVTARLTADVSQVPQFLDEGIVPVLVDPEGLCIAELQPAVIVDARMAKINLGTTISDAPLVIAMGPGFTAGMDCHVVIETNRGHDLGRVIYDGAAELDTGEPGMVQGQTHSRILRAPAAGHVDAEAAIGDQLDAGQKIATINGHTLFSPFAGVLRGLIHKRVWVESGMKIGDLDPRARRENCFTISDKSLAVGGGVLEAVFAAPQVRPFLSQISYEAAKSV